LSSFAFRARKARKRRLNWLVYRHSYYS